MTPALAGVSLPWQISLSSHTDRSVVEPLLVSLRGSADSTVGDNQPYDLDRALTTPFRSMRRNLRYLQIEFRQDEVADAKGETAWARHLAVALSSVLRISLQSSGT